ncbi:hypothetical protein [Poseidonibacter antarcticus]|uniref:hypothetical protein n=1 Tax=Poseidonibacter antarcticus TaxID=2478538 RepID=UPI000EF4C5D4|nr:hypothetical protein [Poseidonibacter antarcticus]
MRLLTLLLFIFISFVRADIVIVTNKKSDINHLSKDAVKYLYLAKVNKINNIKIKALLSENRGLHIRFINNIIGKDIHQYTSYWARLVFTGREAIPRRLNDEEIDEALSHINTIIYMDRINVKKNWKIVYEQ